MHEPSMTRSRASAGAASGAATASSAEPGAQPDSYGAAQAGIPASPMVGYDAASTAPVPSFTPSPHLKKGVERGATASKTPSSAKRSADRGGKGLRHFSLRVCQKVEEKQKTTYNEVADELVAEFMEQQRAEAEMGRKMYEEKNIRRRVYDAINVLMAMDIISKEKKEIRWKGLPSNATRDMVALKQQRDELSKRLTKKRKDLEDLLRHQIAFNNLVLRNQSRSHSAEASGNLPLPFVLVTAPSSSVVRVDFSQDAHNVFLNFSQPFEIHDDAEVLQRLKLHLQCLESLPSLLPPQLLPFLPDDIKEYVLSKNIVRREQLEPPQHTAAASAALERGSAAAAEAAAKMPPGTFAEAASGMGEAAAHPSAAAASSGSTAPPNLSVLTSAVRFVENTSIRSRKRTRQQ